MNDFLLRLPPRFRWTLHNLLAHPLSEVLWQLGAERAADWVHDVTVPPLPEYGLEWSGERNETYE